MEIIVTVESKSFYRCFTIQLAHLKNVDLLKWVFFTKIWFVSWELSWEWQAWFQCNYVEWLLKDGNTSLFNEINLWILNHLFWFCVSEVDMNEVAFLKLLPLKVEFCLNCINNSQISWLDSFVHPIKNNPFPSSTLIYNFTLKYGFHKNYHL